MQIKQSSEGIHIKDKVMGGKNTFSCSWKLLVEVINGLLRERTFL